MKALTIQEPYATLIMLGYKKIETRSWKTNYRGKIYIHAGKSKNFLNNIDSYTKNISKNINLHYGNIICKAELVDCVKITPLFIHELKKNNMAEYKLGIYVEGRYAWILANIEILKKEIMAKGKLNIWNYEEEISEEKLTLT